MAQSSAAVALRDTTRWWVGELAAMIPQRLKVRRKIAARSDIHLGRDYVTVERVADRVGERFVDARPLDHLDEDAWGELRALVADSRVQIILSPPDIFVTSIVLPNAARRSLRSAVALQMSQTTPIEPELLCWSMMAGDKRSSEIDVRLAMARSDRIASITAAFEDHGFAVPPIVAADGEERIVLAPGKANRQSSSNLNRRARCIAVLLLASIPLTIIVGAEILTRITSDRIAQSEQALKPRLAIERQARHDESLRRMLRPLLTTSAISDTLEDLAQRLPATAALRTLEQGTDRSLTFTVDVGDTETLAPALAQAPLLPELAIVDQMPAADGRMTISYRTAPR